MTGVAPLRAMIHARLVSMVALPTKIPEKGRDQFRSRIDFLRSLRRRVCRNHKRDWQLSGGPAACPNTLEGYLHEERRSFCPCVFSGRSSVQLFRASASPITLTDMSNHPMKNTVQIRTLVSTIVDFPEDGIVVSEDGPNRININLPTSMLTARETWLEAKEKLEQMFPGWRFSYS